MAIRQEGNTYYGLSTDTKPTGAVLNGREFKEMDTGKKYLFDAENGEWLEQPEEGGGGGGGSSGILVVHVVEIPGTENFRLDKTWQEIWDAQTSGVIVAISNGYAQGNTAEWSCAPISMINADTDYGLWSVYELGGVAWNCLSATDYPQTGIG